MNQDCKKNELMANTFFMLFFNGAIEWHVVTVSFPIHFSCSVNQTFKDSRYKSKLSFMSIWKRYISTYCCILFHLFSAKLFYALHSMKIILFRQIWFLCILELDKNTKFQFSFWNVTKFQGAQTSSKVQHSSVTMQIIIWWKI